MKLISWNVNGLRAVMKKGFLDFYQQTEFDFLCLQEIKLQEDQLEFDSQGYYAYYNYAEKKGYSGTAIFAKEKPNAVTLGIGIEEFDHEGRVITLEYDQFYLVTCYTPNSQQKLARLDFRMKWEEAFQSYCANLAKAKGVLICGDLNVAHEKIDLKHPSANRLNAGFSDEERAKMTQFLAKGFIDTFRYFYPDKKDCYTWWSYFNQSRSRNVGWRIDYFLASESLKEKLVSASILDQVLGSDHCPVVLEINL